MFENSCALIAEYYERIDNFSYVSNLNLLIHVIGMLQG